MIIHTKVKTSQKTFRIEKTSEKADIRGSAAGIVNWTISVKSAPENNAEKKEIIKELYKEYASVRIVWGLKSKNKILDVS